MNIESNFAEKCELCPNLCPTARYDMAFADDKPYATFISMTCAHEKLCDNIEVYLRESLALKGKKENK